MPEWGWKTILSHLWRRNSSGSLLREVFLIPDADTQSGDSTHSLSKIILFLLGVQGWGLGERRDEGGMTCNPSLPDPNTSMFNRHGAVFYWPSSATGFQWNMCHGSLGQISLSCSPDLRRPWCQAMKCVSWRSCITSYFSALLWTSDQGIILTTMTAL